MKKQLKVWLVILLAAVLIVSAFLYMTSGSQQKMAIPTEELFTLSISDADHDGLTDSQEQSVAQMYAPILIFDEEESDCVKDVRNNVAVIDQVTPLRDGVVITYVYLYPKDCSVASSGIDFWTKAEHNGDSEALRIYVRNGWAERILMKRHNDSWRGYDQSKFKWESFEGTARTHPIIWVSESKHAMYESKGGCESYGALNWEDCGGGDKILFNVTMGSNIGERNAHTFDSLAQSTNVKLSTLYPKEFAWKDVVFCGNRKRGKCAGSIAGKWWPPRDKEDLDKQTSLIFP